MGTSISRIVRAYSHYYQLVSMRIESVGRVVWDSSGLVIFVFGQDASSSILLGSHTDSLPCLLVNALLKDDGGPVPNDSFVLHLLFKGFVMTIGMVEPTAATVVDLVDPWTTGPICKVLLPDRPTSVKLVVCLTQAED